MPSPFVSSPTIRVPISGNPIINSLLFSATGTPVVIWGNSNGSPLALSYSFPGLSSVWANNSSTTFNTVEGGFLPLSPAQQSNARIALSQWGEVANLNLTEITETANNVGDIRIAFTALPLGSGVSSNPQSDPGGGDIWISSKLATTDFSPGTFTYFVLLHELGHTLGFKHPHDTLGMNGTVLPIEFDNQQYTIMSYSNHLMGFTPKTPMVLDIQAMQYLYGANLTTRTGNDNYVFSPLNVELKTIWDAGGIDTFDASAFSMGVTIDLREGHYSVIGMSPFGLPNNIANIGIAYGAIIENATGGSGDDVFTGNSVNNIFDGASGYDTVIFSGNFSNYKIAYDQIKEIYTVTDTLGNDGIDILKNIETIKFSDKSAYLTPKSSDGSYSFTTPAVTLKSVVFKGASDIIFSSPDSESIDGGGGIDTVYFTGSRADHTISLTNTAITVSSSADGFDSLVNVERLKFTDTNIALDISANQTAGSCYMLYKAAFNRTPDANGLGFWINKMDIGIMDYSSVAQNFVNSAEFKTAFGGSNPSVNTLVTKLYNNVLNRTPDASGLAFWQDKLSNAGWTTAGVLGYFSTSSENVANVTPLIANGIAYTEYFTR